MRRTHVIHPKDNRRPHFGLRHHDGDQRMFLRWERGTNRDTLVLSNDDPSSRLDMATVNEVVTSEGIVYVARLTFGSLKGVEVRRDTYDAARLFCEARSAGSRVI